MHTKLITRRWNSKNISLPFFLDQTQRHLESDMINVRHTKTQIYKMLASSLWCMQQLWYFGELVHSFLSMLVRTIESYRFEWFPIPETSTEQIRATTPRGQYDPRVSSLSDVHSQSCPKEIILKSLNNVTDHPDHTYWEVMLVQNKFQAHPLQFMLIHCFTHSLLLCQFKWLFCLNTTFHNTYCSTSAFTETSASEQLKNSSL